MRFPRDANTQLKKDVVYFIVWIVNLKQWNIYIYIYIFWPIHIFKNHSVSYFRGRTRRNVYQILFANLQGGRLFWKSKCTRKNNIKVRHEEAGFKNVNWI